MADDELYYTAAEALTYAKRQGYPFGKSKFYGDLKYVPRVENKFAKKEIDKYIKPHIKAASGLDVGVQDKTALEVAILQEDLRQKKKKNDVGDGLYILRSEVEQLHAAKLQHLTASFEGFIQSKVTEIINRCGGDSTKAQDLIFFCLEEVRVYLDEYAVPCRYSMPLKEKEEGAKDAGKAI